MTSAAEEEEVERGDSKAETIQIEPLLQAELFNFHGHELLPPPLPEEVLLPL